MPKETPIPKKTMKDKSMVSSKAAAQMSSAKKPSATKQKAKPMQTMSQDELRGMIAEAAYYRALERNFSGGAEQDDWLMAEQEIHQQFSSSKMAH
jgi:hypothetical protein